ncbi:MAG TPA: hypothetical protein VFW54_04990 [Propionibacteriaceae bacterium]|nr:hypothetical protein [Propionibacteriaceae bacterium]
MSRSLSLSDQIRIAPSLQHAHLPLHSWHMEAEMLTGLWSRTCRNGFEATEAQGLRTQGTNLPARQQPTGILSTEPGTVSGPF